MIDRDTEKEKIGILKMQLNQFWNAFFIIFGGSLTLLFSGFALWKIFAAGVGIFFAFVFLLGYFVRHFELEETFKLLRKDGLR
jgi:hypothetical protein